MVVLFAYSEIVRQAGTTAAASIRLLIRLFLLAHLSLQAL